MTTELSADDRNALVEYRFSRAMDTIAEAQYNADGGYFNTAVNRLYYAAFYAASALMTAYNHSSSTHAGLKTLLSLHFVKTGLLAPEHAKTFMILFENRQSGDYEDFVYCDLELFEALLPRTIAFINSVKEIVSRASAEGDCH